MMKNANGLSDALMTGASALGAYAVGAGIVAHNIANVSTDNYNPIRADYINEANGVSATIIPETANTGSLEDAVDRPSGTELSREFAALIASSRAFEANARAIVSIDDAMGTVLSIKG